MNRTAFLLLSIFVVAVGVGLAVTIGSRLSNEAMAVLTGAVCGVGAVLPATILGALALLRPRANPLPNYLPHSGRGVPYPPVVYIPPALPGGNMVKDWPVCENITQKSEGEYGQR